MGGEYRRRSGSAIAGNRCPPRRPLLRIEKLDSLPAMRLVDIQTIGDELAIKWAGGTESYLKIETLRRHCPCAGCKGETDIMGNLYKNPDQPLKPESFRLVRLAMVGGYAIQPLWADGHGTGLFSFDYLKAVADAE